MIDERDREELLTTQTTDETEDSKPQISSKEKVIEPEIVEQRKKPLICIPVFDINLNYLNMKLKKSKKNSSKSKNNYIHPLNKDQNQNQINAQMNNNNSKGSDNKNKEEDKLENPENILNDSTTDDKNPKNNDISYNNLKVDLGFLSRTNSEIGDDLKSLNDINKNININDNKLNNINNQLKTKNQSPFMNNQLLLNNLGMMNNINNINNRK